MRAAAISMPGSDLSQPAKVTRPSSRSACMTASTESAMTSRDTSEARMPSWPMEMPSLTAMVVNSMGNAPADRTPSLHRLARRSSGRLHGVTSFHEEATPTWPLPQSSSVMPMARSMARAGARSQPSVTSRLRIFMSTAVAGWRGYAGSGMDGKRTPLTVFGRSRYDREIARLAIPAFGALIAEPIYLLTDTAIVGHLGTPQLGGLAVAMSILLTLFAVFIFLAYGTTAPVSRLLGAGDEAEAAHQVVQSLWLAGMIGVALVVVGLALSDPLVALFGAE